MVQAALDQMITQLDAFELEELEQIEHAIQKRRASNEAADKQVAYHQALFASGLVTHIARRTELDRSERHLIEVESEQVSETILRERR